MFDLTGLDGTKFFLSHYADSGDKGFSPRNLNYMRAFAAAWPERAIVQEALAWIPWYHHIALLEKCRTPEESL